MVKMVLLYFMGPMNEKADKARKCNNWVASYILLKKVKMLVKELFEQLSSLALLGKGGEEV
jgi:hypothetical protein